MSVEQPKEDSKENVYKQPVVANKYELLRSVPEAVFEEYAERMVDQIPENGKVVDAGFGPGHILIDLARVGEGKNLQVTGIDSSAEMHKLVKEKMSGLSIGNINLVQEEMRLYFSNNPDSLDAIHFKAILHCIQDQEDTLDAMDSALHSGGLIITGHESSQTESRIERLYETSPNIDDPELESVVDYYFSLREELARETGLTEKRFEQRKFPAGDSRHASQYFLNKGYSFVSVSGEKDMNFERKYTIGELVDCIKNGTFGVFRDGLTPDDMSHLAQKVAEYVSEKNIDQDNIRKIPARMQQYILRKP